MATKTKKAKTGGPDAGARAKLEEHLSLLRRLVFASGFDGRIYATPSQMRIGRAFDHQPDEECDSAQIGMAEGVDRVQTLRDLIAAFDGSKPTFISFHPKDVALYGPEDRSTYHVHGTFHGFPIYCGQLAAVVEEVLGEEARAVRRVKEPEAVEAPAVAPIGGGL